MKFKPIWFTCFEEFEPEFSEHTIFGPALLHPFQPYCPGCGKPVENCSPVKFFKSWVCEHCLEIFQINFVEMDGLLVWATYPADVCRIQELIAAIPGE